jgi:predicted GTPase
MTMARGLFITGFTVAEVLTIQQKAKSLLMEGKTIMNWNDAETSVSKQFTMPVDQVLEECACALKVLDPQTYGRPKSGGVSFIHGYLAK